MQADKLSKLKIELLAQQNIYVRQTQVNQSAVRASFWIAQLKASSRKPFTDGEFVKKCVNAVIEEVCPEKKDVFNTVSLSVISVSVYMSVSVSYQYQYLSISISLSITRRIEEIGGNLYAHLLETKEYQFFFISTGREHGRAGNRAAANFYLRSKCKL